MPVDIKAGNAIANTVSQQLQSINKTLDVANSGSAQAANIAAISGAVLGNADLVDSIGPNGAQALTADFASVTNDMLGTGAASGGNAAAFQSDMAKLTQDLNNAGVQFDTSNGQGHYDSSTLVPSSFAASASSPSQTTPSTSVATGVASPATDAAPLTPSAQHASQVIAQRVYLELNSAYTVIDDTTPQTLQTSLSRFSGIVAKMSSDPTLPADLAAKLKTYSGDIAQQATTIDPANFAATEAASKKAIDSAFFSLGIRQDAGLAAADQQTVTKSMAEQLGDYAMSVYPFVQDLASKQTITPNDAATFYKQLESQLVNTPTPTLEARESIEKSMTAIQQAASTYAAAGASTSGGQNFLASVQAALNMQP